MGTTRSDCPTLLITIRAVVFDAGERLVTWADWLEVPRHTFAAAFGAVIAQGGVSKPDLAFFSHVAGGPLPGRGDPLRGRPDGQRHPPGGQGGHEDGADPARASPSCLGWSPSQR
jgi:hypothetical protein